jgi:hypothetical protein
MVVKTFVSRFHGGEPSSADETSQRFPTMKKMCLSWFVAEVRNTTMPAWAGGEEKAKRWGPWQFSLRSLLMLSILVGAFLAGRLSVKNQFERKYSELREEMKDADALLQAFRKVRLQSISEKSEQLSKELEARLNANVRE